jgi:hypothetical protein
MSNQFITVTIDPQVDGICFPAYSLAYSKLYQRHESSYTATVT